MQITFMPLGGGDEIGASAYYLEVDGERFLLDCGVRLNAPLYYPDFSPLYRLPLDGLWELSGVFITHAHFDHVGGLPRLYPEAQKVPVYATKETAKLARLQLESMARRDQSREPGPKPEHTDSDFGLCIYPARQLKQSLEMIQPVEQGSTLEFSNCRVTFFPAGHVLGASMLYVETEQKNILYTGDFTDFDQQTVPGFRLPVDLEVDVLVVESTYGYREACHAGTAYPAAGGRKALEQAFALAVAETVWQYGVALIPAFALGRSQEVARLLASSMDEGLIPFFPVYLDGLAAAVSRAYEKCGVFVFDERVQKAPPRLLSSIQDLPGIAVVASSGMLLPGSCSAKYWDRILSGGKNALFFSGYLHGSSPATRLLNGNRGQKPGFQAAVERYHLSAHAQVQGLMNLIRALDPQSVVFVHGFPKQGSGMNIMEQAYHEMPDRNYFQACNGMPFYL